MNETIQKFGYPETLLAELRHWVILVRPAQVTLGSLVLAAKSEATAYSALPPEAFAEQAAAVARIERALAAFCGYEKINYLMLMMVDRHVHFHVIPRYAEPRRWAGAEWPDAGWPGPPQLAAPVALTPQQLRQMAKDLKPGINLD